MRLLRKHIILVCVFCIFMIQPCLLFADYIMMCTFFECCQAGVFSVSEEGDISFKYFLNTPFDRTRLVFAPNGKWGLMRGAPPDTFPEGQVVSVLVIDENNNISILGSIYNNIGDLVAISPNSRYGIYGGNLESLRYFNGIYEVIPSSNPDIAGSYASFSLLNNHFFYGNGDHNIREGEILPDGRAVPTGFSVNINPSNNWEIAVSPDGRTCIVAGVEGYTITVLRVQESGGCSLVQQFSTAPSYNPYVVDFTPDSQYAIVSYIDNPCMRCFRIKNDSHLTEVSSLSLPWEPGEDMAVTPDGKFAITRALLTWGSQFYVVRIHEDGILEYLPDKDYACSGDVSAIAFVPPQITAANPSWNMYQ